MMSLLLSLLACGSDAPVWALQHLEVTPSAAGVEGTQAWEFFREGWAQGRDPDDFLCARAQSLRGQVRVAPTGCASCTVAYGVEAEELDTHCGEKLAGAATYAESIRIHAIGEVHESLLELDPHPGRSLGWYVSLDGGETLTPYGFAYDSALDRDETPGAPGWAHGGTYALWPAFAWDISG